MGNLNNGDQVKFKKSSGNIGHGTLNYLYSYGYAGQTIHMAKITCEFGNGYDIPIRKVINMNPSVTPEPVPEQKPVKAEKTNKTKEFTDWVNGWQKIVDDYMNKQFPTLDRKVLEVSVGRRYIKIIASGSVMAFVDNTTGDIYKPASYRAPAKHVRGNINDKSKGLGCVNPYGVVYLR